MGYICVVPQFVENSKKLNSSEVLSDKATFDTITKTENYLPCFHDAAFVQQQLYVSLIIWASFVVFSILWVVASNQQNRTLKNDEVGFSLALRQWARKDRIAIIINRPLQMFSSLGIFVILVNRCNYLSVDVAEYYIGLVLYLAAFVDTLVRFCAAKQKISYAFSPYTILDIFSLASYFCVGFAPSLMINGKEARTWLDFSIMRSIFIYRSFMEMDSHFDTSTRGIMLFRQAVRCFLLLAWAASVMFFVEMTGELDSFFDNGFAHLYSCSNGTISRSNDGTCGSETWSMMFALYFTVVTLGTVGYGDNAAHYLPSRLLVMVFILAGIILFSMEIQNLVNLYQLRKIGNPPYKPKSRTTQHVVIMGNPTYPQLSATLRELFHPDHFQGVDRKFLHAVVLGDYSSNYVQGLVHRLESDPKFASTVTFVAGDPTEDVDLDRVRLKEAIGAFFLPDKLASDAVREDARNIMHILSVKQYAGYDFPCWAIALRNDNIRHMLSAGVDRDSIVCEETMKMGVMARSCACPGYATFLSNLSSCLSLNRPKMNSHNAPFNLRSKAVHTGDLASTPSTAAQPWMDHYLAGASREFYVVSLSKEFADMTFRDVAKQIFARSKGAAVLIAVEVVVEDPTGQDALAEFSTVPRIHGVRVVLNPGHAMRLKEGSSVYVIADDLASVQAFHITDEEMDDENSNADHSPRLSTRAQYSSLHMPLLPAGVISSSTTTQASVKAAPPPLRYRALLSGESVHLDSTLDRVMTSIRLPTRRPDLVLDPRRASMMELFSSLRGGAGSYMHDKPRELTPPPMSVLEDPRHIVVCSFLGEESLAALQWFITPLRGVYSLNMPPITILDASPPTGDWVSVLTKFSDVYYVCGSPLVYQELQRAGAKSAHSVLVLAKKSKNGATRTDGAGPMEATLMDADAIFTTMLVDLKMNPSRMFTLTELTDESNSKLLNKRFVIEPAHEQHDDGSGSIDKLHSMWDIALSASSGVHNGSNASSTPSIYSMPLYMSGRLMHPQFCENLLVQSYYDPSIHRILRQLVGGPRSTGIICAVPLPRNYHHGSVEYGMLFHAYADRHFPGILLGVYRKPPATLSSTDGLPVVLTCPVDSLTMEDGDVLYVLYGWNVLEDAAKAIQAAFRANRRRRPQTRAPLSRRRTTIL
ncbi:hypothetical protein H310_09183 [Aphanomyces invadans]|uniref:Potassium channel domain-containing protein n=1 Tax=Aphanomyces invadans TaxID=157072 RepID=A0A024TUK3_9STRA|nr:hypothetical protein H310_09183 [Aphanomyces invadans]ETV97845.1 hypothetical protein H310_09183 [Aphanomyces invadans]|eukprot:XP_008873406.1 hypothetical protein H310_09183 [Aphanomyces invadans]